MSLIDRLLTILTPYECLGCAAEGDLLCSVCIQQLPVSPERCYRCLRSSPLSLTCSGCVSETGLYRVRAVASYAGHAKELVGRLKFSGARAAAPQMAACMASLVQDRFSIVPVPTATSRIRGRGYDQARLLARELGRHTRMQYLDCLIRSGHTHQVGASRQQRQSQLRGAFRINAPDKVRGRRILLIDDVVTTGATLETAARVLRAAGAERVEAAVFAQA